MGGGVVLHRFCSVCVTIAQAQIEAGNPLLRPFSVRPLKRKRAVTGGHGSLPPAAVRIHDHACCTDLDSLPRGLGGDWIGMMGNSKIVSLHRTASIYLLV